MQRTAAHQESAATQQEGAATQPEHPEQKSGQ
jgi:hypothetical protein